MKIILKSVSKFYKSETNVSKGIQDVSATFETGEIVAITGESGSGKSTFLNVTTIMDSYEAGELLYDDIDVAGLSKDELEKLRREKVSFIFQNYNIIDSYTVLQNVICPLIINGIPYKEANKRAKKIIERVGLGQRMYHRGTKLSGGEKQRCVIARALASDSKVLACDEPTGNLDSKTSAEIMELIKEVSVGKIVFIVTHNYKEVESFATRKLSFFDSKLIEDKVLRPYDNKELESEEISVSKKGKALTMLKIAFDNVFSTPRRSWFSFFLFFMISIVFIVLISTVLGYKDSKFYSTNDFYQNNDPNRMIVYSSDGSYLDSKLIGDNISYSESLDNLLFSEVELSFYLVDRYNDYQSFYYKNMLTDEKILFGTKPQNNREVVVGCSLSDEDLRDMIGDYIEAESNKDVVVSFKIVGTYYSNQYYITGNKEGNCLLKKYAVDLLGSRMCYGSEMVFEKSSEEYINFYTYPDFQIPNPDAAITVNVDMYRSNSIPIKINLNKLKVNYLSDERGYRIVISSGALYKILNEDYSMGSFYSTKNLAKKDMKAIESISLTALWPAKHASP